MGVSVDLITTNLGKGTLMPSSELSVSINERLIFSFEKEAISANYSSLVLCSSTDYGVQLMLGINQGGSPRLLTRMG